MGKTLSDNAINQIKTMRVDVRQLKSQEVRSISAGLPPLLPGAVKTTESAPLAIKAIIGFASNGMYSVTLYGNGYSQPATGTTWLEALEVAYGELIPSGTKVIAYLDANAIATGSGEV